MKNETAPPPASREVNLSGDPTGVRDEVSLETIIRQVTERVIHELSARGIQIVSIAGSAETGNPEIKVCTGNGTVRSERADMTGYRTPVLIERHVLKLQDLTRTLIVPPGTVISPKAAELLREKNIQLCIE
jgi:hypothetical protein